MSALSLTSVVVRSPDQVCTNLGEEAVVLGLSSEAYYSLKGVGGRVWELLTEPRAVREVLATLVAEYAVEAERCEADLLALLQDLLDEKLIEVRDAATG